MEENKKTPLIDKVKVFVSFSIVIAVLAIIGISNRNINTNVEYLIEEILQNDSLKRELVRCQDLTERFRDNNPDWDYAEEIRLIKIERNANKTSE